jgi:hypothetical protein
MIHGRRNLGLKHLAFFAACGESEEHTLRAQLATAALLTVRLIDHWTLAGSVMVEPESVSVRSVRDAISAIPADHAHRAVLFGLINTMQTTREVDVVPILPYLKKYEELLDHDEWSKPLAYDLCLTMQRLQAEWLDDAEEIALLRTLLGPINPPQHPASKKPKKAKKPRRK